MGKYVLDGHVPRLEPDVLVWAAWFEQTGLSRIVEQTTVWDTVVSTVFLGIDHQWGEGPPRLFETMVFGGPFDEEQERCGTWAQAEAVHSRMVAQVEAIRGLKKLRMVWNKLWLMLRGRAEWY